MLMHVHSLSYDENQIYWRTFILALFAQYRQHSVTAKYKCFTVPGGMYEKK